MNSKVSVFANKIKQNIPAITFVLLLCIFLVSSFLYALRSSVIFPIINVSILILLLYLFHGKYRIYSLIFCSPFIVFFNYKPFGFGSFYSYFIILYCVTILVEFFIKREKKMSDLKPLFLVGFLALYAIILTLIFSGFNSVLRTISIFGYLASFFFLVLDTKGKKNPSFLLLFVALGLFLANVISYFIIYVVKGDVGLDFIERFINHHYAIQYKQLNLSFRFPGLAGDPNYLGLYTGFLTAIYIIFFKKIKCKWFLLPIVILLQVFPILGESKNYFIILIIGLIFAFIYSCFKFKKGIFIANSILICSIIVFLIFGNKLFVPIISRIINLDFRLGTLKALTTSRTSLQILYFNEYITNPTSFIFGKGFGNVFINGASAHSTYIMTFWYFGIAGTVFYYLYLYKMIGIHISNKKKFLLIPLLIPLFYGLSLDFVSYSEMLIFLLFIYSVFYKNFSFNADVGFEKYETII